MHITFGLSLDARQGPSPDNSFNAPLLGRMGFLSLLETYLGLAQPEVAAAQQVTLYLGQLQQHDHGNRFYSASLRTDSVGTAARLLAWREEWLLGGWQGDAQAGQPARLQDLAAVEATAAAVLPPGEATRLARVEQVLKATGPGPITGVTLVDPLDEFPLLWRRVLACLPAVRVQLPMPQGSGALRALQEKALRVMAGQEPPSELPPATDGSVQLVRALTATTAERWLSAHTAAQSADRLVLAEERGDSLDASLRVSGGVNCGFEEPSALRPALQALGLALEMCWAPLDIHRLLDFLSHPVGPFSRRARARLAAAVAEQPGIGGSAWQAVKTQLGAEDGGADLVQAIEFWLEGERWQRQQGAPVQAVLARVGRLQDVLRRRLSGEAADAATFAPAYRQCTAVFDSLSEMARQGVATLLPRDIEQLLAQATPAGAGNPHAAAQVGCLRSARSAAACIEPADELIWWMPASPVLTRPLPWSPAEVQALQALGVQLRDPAQQLKALSLQWLRPLLAARQRFVLVLPPPGHEVHPLRQLLQLLDPSLESAAIDLEASAAALRHVGLCQRVPDQPLPQVGPQIMLPQGVNLADHQRPQSYTTLNDLFNAPALYALKRLARLKPAATLAAEEDNRLLGILAHRVIEKLFDQPDALRWPDDQALAWFHGQLDELLRTEGAVLLMQGAGMSLQHFQRCCERAITRLLGHLRAAGAVQVQTEVEFTGTLQAQPQPVPLTGKIDLLVTLPGDRQVALDMKWGSERRHAQMLQEGAPLQLALYANLIEQQTGRAPVALGYFILGSGALYISQPGVFPQAQLKQAPTDQTVTHRLDEARATWKWRTGQLADGQIDVVPTKPTDDDQGPEGTLPVKGPSPWDRDHLILLGNWE